MHDQALTALSLSRPAPRQFYGIRHSQNGSDQYNLALQMFHDI